MSSRLASAEAVATELGLPVHPRAGVSLHLIEDEGVLLDTAGQKLYGLNTTGAFIWCCIEDGASATACVARMRSTFDISERDARSYVAAAVGGWQSLGLLAGAPIPPPPVRSQNATAGSHVLPPFAVVDRARYRLLDTTFELRFASCDTAAYLDRFLAPLRESAAEADDRVIIDVRENGGQRALYRGDRLIERWVAPHELVPAAKIALVMSALERSRDFGALHAGAVCLPRRDGPCIVIAGPSGAGKSTLVAGLVANGLCSLGDDTIALARDTLAVRPVPFGICLKDGAWDLLSTRIGLATLPVHRRLDGKRVKYLVPESASDAPGHAAHHPACAVIFPSRREHGPAGLIRLTPAAALARLAPEFCPLGGELDDARVGRLIGWIRGMTCFEMRYSTLDDGIKTIGELCS